MVRSFVRGLSGVLLAWMPWAVAVAQSGTIRGTVADSAGAAEATCPGTVAR